MPAIQTRPQDLTIGVRDLLLWSESCIGTLQCLSEASTVSLTLLFVCLCEGEVSTGREFTLHSPQQEAVLKATAVRSPLRRR